MSVFVQRSLKQAQWRVPDIDLNAVERFVRAHDLPEIVARLLVSRDVDEERVASFLSPTLRHDFPDPFSMAGMKECAQDVAQAIIDGRRFAIFGDFDVDGATSSAVVARFLRACGVQPRVYIPERLTEGYGPNETALKELREAGVDVLLMLDCGTAAVDTIKAGQDMGLQIVILDHHEPSEVLPPAWHLINPKRTDDESGLEMMAAVGVVFLFCVAVNSSLRDFDFYSKNNIKQPDVKALLDFVALGTVCDMVPLTHVNRLFVKYGFEQMTRGAHVGLKALARVSGVEAPFDTYTCGFVFGPRVNAGSRVGKSDLGATLFITDDSAQAEDIAWTLNDCNDKRKAMQSEMEEAAVRMAETADPDAPIVILAKDGWHSGLTGLVAGRIKDHTGKPACVVSLEDGVGKGSGRSIPGVHLGQLFLDAQDKDLVLKGGGHAMAGGFTIEESQLDRFCAFAADHVRGQLQSIDPTVHMDVDIVSSVRGALNVESVKVLQEKAGPFGQGFEDPLTLLQDVVIHAADVVGEAHIKLLVSDVEGGPRMKVMAFRSVGTELGEALLQHNRRMFHLLGHLKVNSWQGRETAEMHLRDAALSQEAVA